MARIWNYATAFDIDWSPLTRAPKDKVLLPILGETMRRGIESGYPAGLRHGGFIVTYFQHLGFVVPNPGKGPILRPGKLTALGGGAG